MTKAQLLDDDEELDFQPTIQVNEDYAKRFEHNKRREELHRLQEKHPELAARLARQAASEAGKAARKAAGGAEVDETDEDEESSSDDDDDDELLENDDTDKVLETLVRIKKKDPVVYQKDAVLFPDSHQDGDAADGSAEGKSSKGSRPVYLRTVLAKQALEGGAASSDDEADNDELPRQPVSHSYAAEQQELKTAFLQAAAEAEHELTEQQGLLKQKKRDADAAAGDGDEDKEQQVNKLLDEYFGKDDQLDAADAFLKSFLANKAWKEPADGAAVGFAGSRKRLRGMDDDDSSVEDDSEAAADGEAGGADDDEDEQFLEEVDRFEAAYNFRYEEPGSHKIQSFPRVIDDSARRPDDRRKRQRQAKAERKAAEREEREAELRRLKNLKKDEINSMMARIQEEAGIKAKPQAAAAGQAAAGAGGAKLASLMDELLEGEFDPEEYDRRMAEAFNDEYYEDGDDTHELFGDAEEEFADEADVEAVTDPESVAGFAALRQKLKQQQSEPSGESDADIQAAKSAAMAEQRSQLQRMLEDYYKLDYEDNIGGLQCRFKYREVPAESFGLTDEDVLAMPDKQLNQIVGLRLLAPYREDTKRLRPNYKALQTIKGEAAAKQALRQERKDREKRKEKQKQQQAKQQGKAQQKEGQQLQQQQDSDLQHAGGKASDHHQQQQQQRQQFKKQRPQQHLRPVNHGQQQHRQQQQKSLAEMTAEEKQAARLASYAKLTLKPSKEAQLQHGGTAAASGQHKSKKRKAGQLYGEEGEKKKSKQVHQPGRLATVQVEAPLTKAQKKNLLRALKRKEKQQQQQQQPA